MPSVELIGPGEHAWKTGEFGLCQIGIAAATLAEHLTHPLIHWHEDGLGEACGFACRLSSGLVISIQELQEITKRTGQKQCDIHVDAADFRTHGADTLLEQLIDVFGLSASDILWVQPAA